jgi:F-type H+-transporting ATPase subunit gamma
MTERLADIGARITGVRQLGAVVNAMRGIAAARAQQARNQLAAVDAYAGTIADGIGRVLALSPDQRDGWAGQPGRPALVLFCAEQGFAGAFSERVLDAADVGAAGAGLFLVGTRGLAVAAERGVTPGWSAAMPSHSAGVPKLADRITAALYAYVAAGGPADIDAIFTDWQPGHGRFLRHRRLLPLDPALFPHVADRNPALMNLAPHALLAGLTAEHLHAQLCNTALHAFAAENEARMETMAAARTQIERQLSSLLARQRTVRQEEITAEIIELAAGEAASLGRTPA